MDESNPQLMQCMEVWGGNQAADRAVVMPGLDAWVHSKPFGQSEAGGDVYYLSACATGRILRMLVADVAGHGQAVRGVAVQLRGLMRDHVNRIDQKQFVRALNQRFSQLARDGCFATAVVSTFFAPTGRLTVCNAGHPFPLIYRVASRQWSFLSPRRGPQGPPTNLPLGVLDLADYRTFDTSLRMGDMVLCYTDSLVESFGLDGQMLGHDGLLKIVQSIEVADPSKFIPALLDAIAAQAPANLTADDVTALLIRCNASGGRTTLGGRLAAVGKLARAVIHSFRPGGPRVPWPDLKLANLGGMIFPFLHRRWRWRERDESP